MIKVSTTLDKIIGERISSKNALERASHKSSGKLSASSLNDPLQWQILHALGVEGKEIDNYTLRRFLRGKQVEDWYVSEINPIATQVFVEYRNCVGYIDAMVDTHDWDWPSGTIPFEIKSVSNAKFKRIESQGADHGHKLQAGLYALSKGLPTFGISYVATDDYRIKTYLFETVDVQQEIDEIISRFDEARAWGHIPAFEPREPWQSNPEYCKYPDWMNVTTVEQADEKYKSLKK